MVGMLTSSSVDRGFEPRLRQTLVIAVSQVFNSNKYNNAEGGNMSTNDIANNRKCVETMFL
jgi:hypothetical protein